MAEHKRNRPFFDMSGEKNVFSYMATEHKRLGDKKNKTILEYLEKNTGVFNHTGVLSEEEVKAMKKRAKENKGNIWHGFLSLNKEESYKIDTPEKCIALIKRTFPSFFKECRLSLKDLDFMCALHLDRPEHLHIHFVFWEKEPKYKTAQGDKAYRAKGKIPIEAINNMKVRLALAIRDDKGNLHKARDNALRRLKEMTAVKTAMTSRQDIKAEILALAKELPKKGRLSYGSRDMEPFRGRVDKIVNMILDFDKEARQSNLKFYLELDKRKKVIEKICGKSKEPQKGSPTYHDEIDLKDIHIVEDLEAEYKRRQGNLIINLAKFIKPEYYERNKNVKYKANDNHLKRRLSMSRKKITERFRKFFTSLGSNHQLLERDFSRRLQEIEEEMKAEKKRQEQEAARNNYKGVNYKG